MRAVTVVSLDGPDAVQVGEVPAPRPGAGDVLIDVVAAGVAFPDVLVTQGRYQVQPRLPFVPGLEVSGVVARAPAGSPLRPGDRVAAVPHFGGFAEQVAVDPRLVFPLPRRTTFTQGAGALFNYMSVDYALVRRGRLRAGETVLVHGAAGGIGTAAVQLARALGARVVAVVSTPAKAAVAAASGAHEVVLVDRFKDEVLTLTGRLGVDVVLDPVGGDRFSDSLRCLKPEGRLIALGFTGGAIPTVEVHRLLNRDVAVIGSAWGRAWFLEQEYLLTQWGRLSPLFEKGDLEVVISSSYPLEQASDALCELADRRSTGKVVLTVDEIDATSGDCHGGHDSRASTVTG